MIRAILLDLFGTVVAYGDIAAGTRLAWEGIYREFCALGGQIPFEEFAREWQAQFLTPLRADEHTGETPLISKLLRLFRSYGLPPDLRRGARLRPAWRDGISILSFLRILLRL